MRSGGNRQRLRISWVRLWRVLYSSFSPFFFFSEFISRDIGYLAFYLLRIIPMLQKMGYKRQAFELHTTPGLESHYKLNFSGQLNV